MRKAITKLFTSRKERNDKSIKHSGSADQEAVANYPVSSKFPRSRHSISTPSSTAPIQQQQSRRKSIHSAIFKFSGREKTSRVITTSEASTVPCSSYKDGAFERTPEVMESKEDELLGSAVGPSVVVNEDQEQSNFDTLSDFPPTPDTVDESEDPLLILSYNKVPVLEQTKLPRGGVSVETKAVGRVQVRFNSLLLALSFRTFHH